MKQRVTAITDWSDGELLGEFAATGSNEAFAALVQRHGLMVHGVCLRVLADYHEAQDVTQAVFLTLARKAAALRKDPSVGGWLHTVAWRLSRNARQSGLRRQEREEIAMKQPTTPEPQTIEVNAFRAEMDDSISQLPERYQRPLVLFHLESLSLEQTADRLGLNVKTTSTRLVRARELLRKRLVRQGVAVGSVTVLATLLSAEAGAAVLPATFVSATVQAAGLAAAGKLAAGVGAGTVSAHVAALTEGALKIMFWSKVKITAIVAACVAVTGTGVIVTTQSLSSQPPLSPNAKVAHGQTASTNQFPAKTNFTARLGDGFIGTVLAIARDAKTITLVSGPPILTNGAPVVYEVTPETQILKGGEPAALEDAVAGEEIRYRVRLRGVGVKPMLVFLELKPPPVKWSFVGTVLAVARDAKTITLVPGPPNRTNGAPVVYEVTPATRILKGDEPAALEDAVVGEEIGYLARSGGAGAKPVLVFLRLGPPAVGIAVSSPTNSFGICLFAEPVDWRDSATNWTTRTLSPKPVISAADIVAYSFTNHLLTLTPEAAKRIAEVHMARLVEPFVVVANGERIYRGAFVSSLCSQSIALPSITLWGSRQFTMDTNLPPNALFIARTYAAPFTDKEPDPRSDERIRHALETLHRLK